MNLNIFSIFCIEKAFPALKMKSISSSTKTPSPLPLSGEEAVSSGDGSLCFSEWGLTTKESFVLDNSVCYSCDRPFSEACGQMDLLPRERAYLSWLNKHRGVKANHSPDTAPILRCLLSSEEKAACAGQMSRKIFATPVCGLECREKSLLRFV